MSENINSYYLEKDYNCAETTLRLANDYYKLNLTEDDLKLVAGFGGGFGSGLTCGDLCADMVVLSKILVKDRAHEDPSFKELCKKFVREFKSRFGGTTCRYLKKKNYVPGVRCLKNVDDNFEFLKEFISKNCLK